MPVPGKRAASAARPEAAEDKLADEPARILRFANRVEPGEAVVTSAQFLIDSESKLREAASKMLEVEND